MVCRKTQSIIFRQCRAFALGDGSRVLVDIHAASAHQQPPIWRGLRCQNCDIPLDQYTDASQAVMRTLYQGTKASRRKLLKNISKYDENTKKYLEDCAHSVGRVSDASPDKVRVRRATVRSLVRGGTEHEEPRGQLEDETAHLSNVRAETQAIVGDRVALLLRTQEGVFLQIKGSERHSGRNRLCLNKKQTLWRTRGKPETNPPATPAATTVTTRTATTTTG